MTKNNISRKKLINLLNHRVHLQLPHRCGQLSSCRPCTCLPTLCKQMFFVSFRNICFCPPHHNWLPSLTARIGSFPKSGLGLIEHEQIPWPQPGSLNLKKTKADGQGLQNQLFFTTSYSSLSLSDTSKFNVHKVFL